MNVINKLKVFCITLGCAKNRIDSEIMLGILEHENYSFTNDPYEGEIIIVNTCGFIGDAKQESMDVTKQLLKCKEEGTCKIFIMAGCLAQRDAHTLKNIFPQIDLFIGTTNFDKIHELIYKKFQEKQRDARLFLEDINRSVDYNLPRKITTPPYLGYLKIAEGCDNHCTYCIIPKLRGRFRSREVQDLVAEAKRLAEEGVKELILIAQDTARYGIDIYGEYKLADLLRELSNIGQIKWIRLLYCYPDIIDDRLIEAIAVNEKVCKYIDMPIQHCNDNILKRMNRRTTKEHIIRTIDRLRNKIPNIAIRTSLIVGFPGECQEQFDELHEFVKEIKLERVGVFAYSREENTAAFHLEPQIIDQVKQTRKEQIIEIQKKISAQNNERRIGQECVMLIEDRLPDENIYVGRTEYDAPEVDGLIFVESVKPLKAGDFVKVRIMSSLEYDLIAELLE